MKTLFKTVGILTIAVIIGFSMSACDNGTTGGGGTDNEPIHLSAGQWIEGEINNPEDSVKYILTVTAGTSYNVWVNDRNSFFDGAGTKTLATSISASYENGDVITFTSNYLTPATSGRVIIEVKPSASSIFNTGTFAITFTVGTDSSMPSYHFNPPSAVITFSGNTWSNNAIINTSDFVWYSYNVTTAQTYYIWWNDNYEGNGAKTADISVSAYYSDGTSIFLNIDSAWASPQSFTAAKTDRVTIRVAIVHSAGDGSRTGSFGIVCRTINERPRTIDTSSAIPLDINKWTTGEITSSVSDILYSVNIANSGEHYFWWNDAQGNGDNTLDVVVTAMTSAEAKIFGSIDEAWVSPSRSIRPAGETIYIKVLPKTPGDTGTFDILYNTSDTRPWLEPASAIALNESEWKDDEINSGSFTERWYTFEADANSAYHIWWNDSNQGNSIKTLDILVSAYEKDGSHIFYNMDHGWNTEATIAVETSGTIYLMVHAYAKNATGTFGIVYSKNTARPSSNILPANHSPLTANQWKDGEITVSSNELWYSFTASSSGTLYFWWNDSYEGNGSKTLDVRVSVLRSNETASLSNVDSAWTSSRSVSSVTSGETIYVRVIPKNAGRTGTFAIVYSAANTRPDISAP